MTEHDDHPVEFLPELTLGVLGDREAAEVRAHVAGCASCRAEYEEMTRAARLLPFAAEDREPSAEMKAGVMERIAGEPRAGQVVRPRPRQWFGLVAAAIALLIVGVTAGWLVGQEDTGDLEAETRRQRAVVNAAADGTLRRSVGEAGEARATLLTVPGSSEAFVMMSGAPELEAGKRYQAWFMDGETPVPGDVFADASGAWLTAEDDLDGYGAVAFTIEDVDGAETPSQTPFMVIPVGASARAR